MKKSSIAIFDFADDASIAVRTRTFTMRDPGAMPG